MVFRVLILGAILCFLQKARAESLLSSDYTRTVEIFSDSACTSKLSSELEHASVTFTGGNDVTGFQDCWYNERLGWSFKVQCADWTTAPDGPAGVVDMKIFNGEVCDTPVSMEFFNGDGLPIDDVLNFVKGGCVKQPRGLCHPDDQCEQYAKLTEPLPAKGYALLEENCGKTQEPIPTTQGPHDDHDDHDDNDHHDEQEPIPTTQKPEQEPEQKPPQGLADFQERVKGFWEQTFSYEPLEDINPCILPGSEYEFLSTVSLPKGKNFPFGASCVVLGERSFFIFVHLKPTKILGKTMPGYIGMYVKYVTTMRTFKARYGTSYESYEGQGNPLVRFYKLGEEEFKRIKKEDSTLTGLGDKAEAYAIGLKEKVCANLAGLANVCTGLAPAEGRRLQEGSGDGSLLMSMDVSPPTGDGAKKSVKLADVDKSGSLTSTERMEFKDGDGDMSTFNDAQAWDETKVKTSTPAPPATTAEAQQAMANLAVATHGSVGLALATLLARAFFF